MRGWGKENWGIPGEHLAPWSPYWSWSRKMIVEGCVRGRSAGMKSRVGDLRGGGWPGARGELNIFKDRTIGIC